MPPNPYTVWRPVKSLPARKRRKTAYENDDTGSVGENGLINENGDGNLVATKGGKIHQKGPPACISCHRELINSVAECTLCHSLSCVICARQCTAPASMLSSEARTGNPPLTLTNTNAASLRRLRRRKLESGEAERAEERSFNHLGCGRTVCRRCCVENGVTHSHTCIQCIEWYKQEKHKEEDGQSLVVN